MKESLKAVVVGAGGFGREVAWIASLAGIEVVGFCDDAPDKAEGVYGGLPLLGSVEKAVRALPGGTRFHVAVGRNEARRSLTARAIAVGLEPVSVIAPTAVIAPGVQIGAGSFVGANAVLSVGVRVGQGVIVNHLASIGHDVSIGDFAQICPCAGLSGGVTVGEEALLGTNASVVPLKRIGNKAVVGIGAIALRDVADGDSIVRLR